MRRNRVLALLAVMLVGCGLSPSASSGGEVPAVHIVNVDGPSVDLLLDDEVIATVACEATATVVPGAGSVPALPWELTVQSSDGTVLGSPSVADPLPKGVLIRGTGVLTGPWPMLSYGPASPPCAPDPTT